MPLTKLTGIWVNRDSTGKVYLNGYLGNARVVILKNDFKKEESNEPDYNLYVDQAAQKQEVAKDVLSQEEEAAMLENHGIPLEEQPI